MIVCKATHNFISMELIERLGISQQSTNSYGVFMGTGFISKRWIAPPFNGLGKGVVVTIQTIDVIKDFLLLDLGNSYIILGI